MYLFTFTNTSFSGGQRVATLGDGYAGARDVHVRALEENDGFGTAVSLNGAGNRLAVGVPFDDGIRGSGTGHDNTGAVYLFTFTDTAFSGGRLVAIAGRGYLGSDGTH